MGLLYLYLYHLLITNTPQADVTEGLHFQLILQSTAFYLDFLNFNITDVFLIVVKVTFPLRLVPVGVNKIFLGAVRAEQA
jgi:hypothetical protein